MTELILISSPIANEETTEIGCNVGQLEMGKI